MIVSQTVGVNDLLKNQCHAMFKMEKFWNKMFQHITTFLVVYIFIDTQNDEDYCTDGSKAEQKKAEKIAFDVNLEKFDTAAKIKQGVTKEEANDMIEKRKAAGGVAIMELKFSAMVLYP
ncbi:hypothetical protein FEM48_Zijuj04G0178900 [Ziziphus jujuba var. spinosa]|uniref:Uncharacterized protein n=1 Tax=Ziziphus jujuba var. spinosa TaxID=714518 RepID=A0A978VLB4_ZIZJJ|nr:hypothetical protein FEM48_Zijuj04G0178900 [Ziziphus jujuba var. spinosa]